MESETSPRGLVSNLEMHIGVQLFDRTDRYPKLTFAGILLVNDARNVVGNVEHLKARANGISAGLEPELSAVIDVLFPIEAIAECAKEFRTRFPRTPLRLYVESLGASYQRVLDGHCGLGVAVALPDIPASMSQERLPGVDLIMVAAREHPLALWRDPIPKTELARHVQLVLTDESELTAGREFGVMTPLTWRLSDLFAKHSFLLKGLGWGGMPMHAVAEDLRQGRLVRLLIEGIPEQGHPLSMFAIYMTSRPPGPAGRWFIERLKQCPQTPAPDRSKAVVRKKATGRKSSSGPPSRRHARGR